MAAMVKQWAGAFRVVVRRRGETRVPNSGGVGRDGIRVCVVWSRV